MRYALLAGIAVTNAYRAHKLSRFAAGLTVPPPVPVVSDTEADAAVDAEARRWLVCRATVTRPQGEVVHCTLNVGHDGFHQGHAQDVPEYTWPDSAGRRVQVVSCTCDSTLLQSDLTQQKADEWVWRIFDVGCDDQERLFAVGTSNTLDEAREDVISTMQELSGNSGFQMSRPEHAVSHHIAAVLQR